MYNKENLLIVGEKQNPQLYIDDNQTNFKKRFYSKVQQYDGAEQVYGTQGLFCR